MLSSANPTDEIVDRLVSTTLCEFPGNRKMVTFEFMASPSAHLYDSIMSLVRSCCLSSTSLTVCDFYILYFLKIIRTTRFVHALFLGNLTSKTPFYNLPSQLSTLSATCSVMCNDVMCLLAILSLLVLC